MNFSADVSDRQGIPLGKGFQSGVRYFVNHQI